MPDKVIEGVEPQGQAGDPEASAPASDWLAGASDAQRALAEQRAWKGLGDVITSYEHLERLKGAPPSELVRLPKPEDQEGWEALYGRLGRPEEATGYDPDLEVGEGQVDLRQLAHQIGLTPGQYQKARAALEEMAQGQQFQASEARQAADQLQAAELEKEWGDEYQERVAIAQQGARNRGWSDETIERLQGAIGFKQTMELAFERGLQLQEDGHPGGKIPRTSSGVPFGLTRETALREINRMQADPAFTSRLYSSDAAVRKAAHAERDRYYRVAYPEG